MSKVSHYTVDLFFPDSGAPDGYRKDSSVIKALSDAEAIKEAQNAVVWRKPSHFDVRAVSRSDDRIIYKSPRT